ncbi:MAG: hypothetical protein NVS2B14_02220 [Chamaesiphon sp.]
MGMKKAEGLLTVLLFLASCLLSLSAQAQTSPTLLPSKAPLELNLLRQNRLAARRDVLTENTISQTQLTIPSLWWAKQQFGGKFVNNWLAYTKERRVDLVVNRQLWSLLDYIDRYSFVNEFGSASRDFGYNIRVFNSQGTLLAAYTCDFSPTQPDCEIWIEASGGDSLRILNKPSLTGF